MNSYNIKSVFSTEKKRINNGPIGIKQVFPMFIPALIIALIYLIFQSREIEESMVNVLIILFTAFFGIAILGSFSYYTYRLIEKNKINKICETSTPIKAEVFNIQYIIKVRSRTKHRNRVKRKYFGFDLKFDINGETIVRRISKIFRQSIIDAINTKQYIDILYSKKYDAVLLIDMVFAIKPH